MLKRTLRWLMPLIALVMLAAYLVISPVISSHAAQITPPSIQSHQTAGPDIYFRP